MGALILLLLVMDRRSKVVARNRALEAHAARLDARSREREMQQVRDQEARRREWEAERQRLHEVLRRQEQELSQERQALDDKLKALKQDALKEKETLTALEKGILEQRARLDVKGQLLSQMRAGIARSGKLDATARQEAEKLARDLADLERALQEARTLKVQERETYSLVPYRGKLGEGRRPVYVECVADALVFQPDGYRLDKATFDIRAFRSEVERRGIALARDKPDPGDRSRPPVPKVATGPYVLFLVRPDGLESYYNANNALRGFDLDFGYEFVDAQWALDFSSGSGLAGQNPANRQGSPARPPTKPAELASRPGYAAIGAVSMSETHGSGAGGSGSGGGPFQAGAGGMAGGGSVQGGNAAPPGLAGGAPGVQGVAGTLYGSSPRPLAGGPGAGRGSFGVLEGLQASQSRGDAPQTGVGGPQGNSIEGGLSRGSSAGPAGAYRPGASPGTASTTSSGGQTGSSTALGNGSGSSVSSAPNNSSVGPGGSSISSDGGPNAAMATGAVPNSSGAGQNTQEPQNVVWRGSATTAVQGASTQSGVPQPAGQPGSLSGAGNPEGASSGAKTPALLGPNLALEEPRPGPKKAAPAPSLGRLLANRDYVLTIECYSDAVALYPGSQVFAVAGNANQNAMDDGLVKAVRQLIARRQATVRAGETPYRPILRFQVHPDALRTYFHVYPLFENLRIPMTRENLDS
jgi:hypothetical protein